MHAIKIMTIQQNFSRGNWEDERRARGSGGVRGMSKTLIEYRREFSIEL